MTQRKLVLSPF